VLSTVTPIKSSNLSFTVLSCVEVSGKVYEGEKKKAFAKSFVLRIFKPNGAQLFTKITTIVENSGKLGICTLVNIHDW